MPTPRRGAGGRFMSIGAEVAAAGTLQELLQAVARYGSAAEEITEVAAEEITDVVVAQFGARTDPYGKPWVDGPYYHGLVRSGAAMLGSLQVVAEGTQIHLLMDDPAIHHQHGAPRANVPQRQIFPDTDGALPDSYRQAIEDAVEAVVG